MYRNKDKDHKKKQIDRKCHLYKFFREPAGRHSIHVEALVQMFWNLLDYNYVVLTPVVL